MSAPFRRTPGTGWLALIGGGEFSFGETRDADAAWLARVGEGPVGFLPTASGSADYPKHFAAYLEQEFEREVQTIPIFRDRDARRGKNLERIADCGALYLGGGVSDRLLEVLAGSPAAEAMLEKLRAGGAVVAIAAAAQALGSLVRPLGGGEPLPGLGWLRGGVVETNFDPGHDRRLRELMASPAIGWGVGLSAGSALLLGPEGEAEAVGTVFTLEAEDGDYQVLED